MCGNSEQGKGKVYYHMAMGVDINGCMCHFELGVAGEWQLYVQLLYNKTDSFVFSGACYKNKECRWIF